MNKFGSEDGGAFAECFYAQYPLNMGRKPRSFASNLPLSTSGSLNAATSLSPIGEITARIGDSASVSSGALVLGITDPVSGSLITSSAEEKTTAELALTTERTREALEKAVKSRQPEEEDFSGRNIRRVAGKKPVLDIIIPGEVGVTGAYDPAPIVRSPTRVKTTNRSSDGGEPVTSAEATTSVPFSIGNWKNKRKLIIPLEQRLMQQAASHTSSTSGGGAISDSVMELALAMQRAKQDVEKVQSAREKARQEEEERLQAEREAEATQRARELLERTAAQNMGSSSSSSPQGQKHDRRRETREERLERIRLERELRDREKQQEARQRRLAKAAVRLGMTVEALEADKELLRTVDETAAAGGAAGAEKHAIETQATRHTTAEAVGVEDRPISAFEDNDETERKHGGIRKGVFGSAVISNEGVRREMEALAKLEEEHRRGGSQIHDGIRINSASDDEDDEDDSGLGMDQIMKRKKRRL